MATNTDSGWKTPFSPTVQRQLLEEDIHTSKTVLAVLVSTVIMGAIAMAVTVVVVL